MESKHKIYWLTRELNPGSSNRPSQSVHTVSQSPAPPSRVPYKVMRVTIVTKLV